jgi:hypothetical protein
MELKEYIKMEIEGLSRAEERVTKGLSQKEIEWQPASGCNSIGLMLLHVFQSEDSFMNEDKTQMLWQKGNWCTKLGMDAKTETAHFKSAEDVNAFKVPKLEKIMAYGAAVRKQTLAKLAKAKAADFEGVVKMPWGEFPKAGIWSMIVGHANQHIAEASYARGIQRGLDK